MFSKLVPVRQKIAQNLTFYNDKCNIQNMVYRICCTYLTDSESKQCVTPGNTTDETYHPLFSPLHLRIV